MVWTRILSVLLCAAGLVAVHSPSGASAADTKLVRVLTGRNEAVRMRALASVQQSASKLRVLDELIAAAGQNVDETAVGDLIRHSTVELLYLVGGVDDPRSEAFLIAQLDAKHPGVAMVAADALGKNKVYGAIAALRQQVSRTEYAESYGFRFNLVRALAQMEHPDAVDALTEMSETLDGQLRYHIDKLLEDVTASHFHGDEGRFAEWKANRQRQRQSLFKTASFDEPESLARMRLERQQYYGIDIHARRLMFIIDHSGSMKKYWGGATRLERAKNELIRAIEELPENSEFAIVFYHTNVRRWRDDLVEATTENKQEAIQFVRRLGYGNKTNTYGALRQSLEFDDDLEAVFLLTDGRPTTGNIIAPSAIVADVLHRNRFRHLNFNTIGIGVGGSTERFLQRLAEESNGEYRVAQ